MAHLQFMPGDPHLVDQLVYELKSKGIFDQFRKDCIADVDTRPAYQNLRQRVESSVSTFLSRQTWRSDLNKNQMREKLRKHILDGNYLDQGVERIVDQVVNPKVASVFMPQVEDLVYNYLGIPRKKPKADFEKTDLLPTDLEAVSPGSVKSNLDIDVENVEDMEIDSDGKQDTNDMVVDADTPKDNLIEASSDSVSVDNSSIPLPTEEIKPETIPAPDDSPKQAKLAIENIKLPIEANKTNVLINIELPIEPSMTDIPLPDEIVPATFSNEPNNLFKPVPLQSEDSNTSSGSSIRRNMSPLTPVRNFDDENSCDAQQAFENNLEQINKEPNSFKFNIETNSSNGSDVKDKNETELSYQFNNQVNINTYNTPMYDDSSNSHNLQIDYESDANTNISKPEVKEVENSEFSKKDRKDDKKVHKSSHRSRDSSRHSSSKDKHSSRDSSKNDKKSSKDEKDKSKSRDKEKSKECDKKDSKHKSSHKSSSSSKDKHRSSSSSHRSSKSSDERKPSKDSLNKDSPSKDRGSDKDKHSKDKKSSSHSDKDRKGNKKDDKDKKKATDDHYSSSGRGNHSRRSTDRDSNDGSSSSKGSHSQNNSKSSDSKKESKGTGKSDNKSTTSSESTSPSDKEHKVNKVMHSRPIVRVDHLETPISNPPRLPFVPDITLKKPKFANNFEEAKKMMKMRKFLAEEQKRMNQEAALLLEFQANVRPSLSQVYSSIPGPELEFACVTHTEPNVSQNNKNDDKLKENDAVKLEVIETKVSDEEVKIEDSNAAFVMDLVKDEHIERKQVTKDIINYIIGVPIDDEQFEVKSDCIIESEIFEIPKVSIECLKIEAKIDDYEENQPFSHLVDENSVSNQSEKSKSFEDQNRPFSDIEDKMNTTADKEISIEESIAEIVNQTMTTEYDITTAETLSETEVSEILDPTYIEKELNDVNKFKENELHYFAEHEKYDAELERHKFNNFLEEYTKKNHTSSKIYLLNCDTYEENIVKEIATNFGDFEVVNYYKNGHLITLKNIIKDVPLSSEISLPVDNNLGTKREFKHEYSPNELFSPVKSECSFELSSDYDAKLDEIVNKKSRQEVMEIILGGMIDVSPSKMPRIDYYVEHDLTVVEELKEDSNVLKRRADEHVNKLVLTQNKIRKMSDSDQISSTTEETEVSNNNKVQSAPRSKYLGRAKRVGLSRPKKCTLPISPSSDKSIENYAQNTATPPNGKLKPTQRSKVQRYDTSDLYKPKLHYLSRRNVS